MSNEIEKTAKMLAAAHIQLISKPTEIWFFPDEKEIHLLEIRTDILSEVAITASHLQATPTHGIIFPVEIGLINPQDIGLQLPEGWCGWDDAKCLYRDGQLV